jgi:succinyl-CoA:acetate CoA-transferase
VLEERIRIPRLRERVTTAEAAASLIRDGMTVATSGFGAAGDCSWSRALWLRERKRDCALP